MPDLYEIATAFRASIEAALKAGEIEEMRGFQMVVAPMQAIYYNGI